MMQTAHGSNGRWVPTVKAVILDWAGTTVDHGSIAPVMSFIETFRMHGVEITVAEARVPMGMHKRDHIRALTKMDQVAERWTVANGGYPDNDDVDAMYEEFIPLQLKVLEEYAEPIPGTLVAVSELRRTRDQDRVDDGLQPSDDGRACARGGSTRLSP